MSLASCQHQENCWSDKPSFWLIQLWNGLWIVDVNRWIKATWCHYIKKIPYCSRIFYKSINLISSFFLFLFFTVKVFFCKRRKNGNIDCILNFIFCQFFIWVFYTLYSISQYQYLKILRISFDPNLDTACPTFVICNSYIDVNPVNFVFVWVPVTGIRRWRFKNLCLIA